MSDKKVTANDHESYGIYSLIAILIPFVGFIMGAIMLTKDTKLDKKLGEHTIVMSILGAVLGGIAWFVYASAVTTTNLTNSIY